MTRTGKAQDSLPYMRNLYFSPSDTLVFQWRNAQIPPRLGRVGYPSGL